jgi:hypothetical protein
LEKTHFLSAGIFKRLRDEDEKNPNPWLISKEKAVQTSKQKWAHLLCSACEQRLNKYGEDWILKNCPQKDGSFPIASILASRPPDEPAEVTMPKIYYTFKIPEINISALSYFAASIFWRGSIYPWKDNGTIPVELGPFQEQFRQYLMGLNDFPKDCSLWVVVRKGEVDRLTHEPVGGRQGILHIYKFPMPGLAFTLITSKNIPANYRKMCFVHGFGNPIFVDTIIDKILKDLAVEYIKK